MISTKCVHKPTEATAVYVDKDTLCSEDGGWNILEQFRSTQTLPYWAVRDSSGILSSYSPAEFERNWLIPHKDNPLVPPVNIEAQS